MEFKLKYGDESELANELRKILGVGTFDEVQCRTPQFEREDGIEVIHFPSTKESFDKLKTLSDKALLTIGLRKWDDKLWLFPYEWYNNIPDGYEVTTILNTKLFFKNGYTDNDYRGGMLAYGIVKE